MRAWRRKSGATRTLGESLPDADEHAAAAFEALRIRDLYQDRIYVQIDLATIPALLDHPTRVFVRDTALCGDQKMADVVAPLVIETSGLVSPLQYRFPRAWSWGNLKDRSLADLAAASLSHDYAAFLALSRSLYEKLVVAEDEPVLNWYQHIHAAATRFSPQQVQESLMPTAAVPSR